MSRLTQRAGERRRGGGDENVLPLINVVFLLLIFFMVVGRLTEPEALPVDPPQSASAGEAGERGLTVLIGADGQLALGQERLALEQLADALAARLEEMEESEGEAQRRRLRVKADAAADTHRVVEVMERLREAGIARVRLMTVPN